MTVMEMIASNPTAAAVEPTALADAVEAVLECSQACTACADACLGEEMVAELRECVRRCLDCADVCSATVSVLSRQTAVDLGLVRVLLEACVVACKRCAAQCEEHAAMHAHCGVCAESCRRAEAAARALLESVRDGGVPQPEPVGDAGDLGA